MRKLHAQAALGAEDDPRMDRGQANIRPLRDLPDWVPDAVRLYLSHTADGTSLRALARARGCHASTVMRQVRRFENRRDDPLIDEALSRLGQPAGPARRARPPDKDPAMTASLRACGAPTLPDAVTLNRDAPPVLHSLTLAGAVLAIAADMDKAVVLREDANGRAHRVAVLDRALAEAMALQDWISCVRPGRVASYAITPAGHVALRAFGAAAVDGEGGAAPGAPGAATDADAPRRLRYGPAEGPVAVLARRRDHDGAPFLTPELVAAADRLREDFELARMDRCTDTDWHRMLDDPDAIAEAGPVRSRPAAARLRVAAALRDLGPGLGDMALRCCCYQEGLETAERRLGWSARSGKIVLRIALQRLRRHYDALGLDSDLIG